VLRRTFLVTALGLPALAGCDNKNALVKVSGTVLIDGKPVPYGKVQIAPEGYRPAFGAIGPDGRFTLTTFKEGDGIVRGTHAVAVIGHETKGPTKQFWHAPKKYISTATSNLTVTVDGPTNDLKIELTWDGGKPFMEGMETE
jgi:hypothetical protein